MTRCDKSLERHTFPQGFLLLVLFHTLVECGWSLISQPVPPVSSVACSPLQVHFYDFILAADVF